MSESAEFELILPFDDDDPAFARGVEVGMLHQRLGNEPLPLTAIVHARNAEMVLRIAECHGVTAIADDGGDEWLTVTFRQL